MTKANSILHRAAALLAALCLLASMALPVYAAETETDFSVSNSETIPGDDNTGNGADGTELDISVSNLETSQKDADTTSEGSKTEPEISVPESGTIPSGTDTTDKAADAPLTEGVTGSENTAPADSAAADKTADADKTGEDSTGSEDEAGFLNEGDSADDRMLTAGNAKESDIALCAGDATVPQGTKYTFYFAPPSDWGAPDRVTVRVLRGQNGATFSGQQTQIMTKTDRNTKDGRPIYTTEILYQKDQDVFCPYGGFVWIHFELGDGKWVGMNGSGSNNWITLDSIIEKCFDAKNAHNGSDISWNESWWKALNDISVPYTKYADQQIRFCNKSETELKQVTAQFYIKDENNALKVVGSPITFGPVKAGETSAQAITIPNKSCAYIGFTVGEKTYYYNFYGEDETDTTIGSFTYSSTRSCFIYDGTDNPTWGVPGTPPGYVRIYFDASLSHLAYTAVDEIDVSQSHNQLTTKYGMPGDGPDQQLHCWIATDEGGTDGEKLPLFKDTTTTTASSRELWYVDIPKECKYINFAAGDVSGINDIHGNGITTGKLKIPDDKVEPCFFADSSDDVIYKQNQPRGGYWGKKDSVRNAAEGKKQTVAEGKDKTVVDITPHPFQNIPGIKYISSTLYDYYTDYELNGNNRDNYGAMNHGESFKQQRNWVTFRQFNRTISDYYNAATDKPNYPIYTGHFEPDEEEVWPLFSNLADTLKLYGWAKSGTDKAAYRKFMATNNSKLDAQPNGTVFKNGTGKYNYTMLGLAAEKLSSGTASGNLLMSGTTDLLEPHFNEAFLKGDNSRNAKIGEVYHNVLFPFTKNNDVFADQPGVDYWWFDSSKTSLYMRQDPGTEGYYLGNANTDKGETSENYKDANSQNLNAVSGTNGVSTTYGFFPFNETTPATSVEKYNYGFGARLEIPFSLTADGQVQDKNGESKPIRFYFSGDDDVWVYIDGQLALDIGGAHGKVSGILDFDNAENDGEVKVYVSRVKNNGTSGSSSYGNMDDDANKTPQLSIEYVGDGTTDYYYKDTVNIPNLTTGTHTLTMFYMERGMWESNMAVAFNFPDHNELQVEKKVDVTGVNDLFKDSFQNQKIFTFNIKNLATHYVPKATSYEEGETKALPEEAYKGAQKPSDTFASLTYAQDPPGKKTGDLAVLWSATRDDPTSAHREQRRGTLPLDSSINIEDFRYLTFDVYVEGETTDTCALGNLYVELWDNQGHQKGCINGKGLQSSDVYGAATALHPKQWYTIRLLLNSLETTDEGFNNILQSIKVGDNFARKIYLRNFTFRSAPKERTTPGFTTEQYDIPDYGSATSGNLENAKYAVFSSDRGNGDVVDENGQFLLQDGETVTFKDQFRRGSYIALQEQVDLNLYDTFWTVYENDAPVTNVSGASKYVTTDTNIKSLENVESTAPDDGRTEKVIDEEKDKNGNPIKNAYVSTDKKPKDNTLVFRSYSDKTDKDELTKLKVVFTNKVKTGKLIIRKYAAGKESLLNKKFTFTVKFSDVGGQGLGVDIPEQKYECTVIKQADGKEYGEVVIDRIPVGTRFVVSEDAHPNTNLQLVTITGGGSDRAVVDGIKARGSVVADDNNVATAKFVNTSRQLTDLVVKKQWVKQDGTTDIPNKELTAAIYLKLQRTTTPGDKDSWRDVDGYKSVELQLGYDGWVKTFTGLDKFDASDTGETHAYYTYRVLESASEKGTFYGGSNGNVIKIGGKKYTILSNKVQVQESSTSPLELTLTNKLQDATYNLNITKQDAEDKTKLGGVEFKLEKLGTDGGPDATFLAVTRITSSEDADKGKCSFENLKPGSYRLTETKTAEGYTLLADAIEFTLTTDGECKRDATDFGDVQYDSTTGVYNIALTINNRKSFELPHTGADAPSLWLLIGLPALVAVLLVLVFRYNRKGGRRQ